MAPKDAILNLRLPSHVKAALEQAAKADLRTTSSMGVFAIAEWLTSKGYLKAPGTPTAKKGAAHARRK